MNTIKSYVKNNKDRFVNELLDLLRVVEGCVLLWPELADLLGNVATGGQIVANDLPFPSEADRKAPKLPRNSMQGRLL